VPRSQAAGDVFKDPDPVLHEPEERRVPGELVAVRDTTAPNDRAQRQHDQTHVVAAADPQPYTQGSRRAAHVPRPVSGHRRVHGNAHQARRGAGQCAGETVAQPPCVLAMTTDVGRDSGSRLGVDERRPTCSVLAKNQPENGRGKKPMGFFLCTNNYY